MHRVAVNTQFVVLPRPMLCVSCDQQGRTWSVISVAKSLTPTQLLASALCMPTPIPITCCHTPSCRNLPQDKFYSCAPSRALTGQCDRLRNQYTALPRWLPAMRAAGLVCTSIQSTVCLCTRLTPRLNHKGIAMRICRQANAGQSLQSWQTCQQHSLTLRKQCTDAYEVQLGNKK